MNCPDSLQGTGCRLKDFYSGNAQRSQKTLFTKLYLFKTHRKHPLDNNC